MTFRSVGTNLSGLYAEGVPGLAQDLEALERIAPDFVEVWPQNLGVILGGGLDTTRLRTVEGPLLETDLTYTVHAPLEVNLMDLTSHGLQRDVLEASLRFADCIGAGVVVCHAGQRVGARDARHSMRAQLSAERSVLREAGGLAEELGVSIAVENYYPEQPSMRGEVYDYSVWPSQLAEQISAVDHPRVGICLDVGHAALAARFFGFDLIQECATITPLVRHVHLHDNLQKTNLTGVPSVSEHTAFGLGDLHLPPRRGTIPLEELLRRIDFPEHPSCCVELAPEFFHLVPEALDAARELSLAVAAREPLSA
jgi:sugar phosphate isomerase/epimerase